MKKNKDSNIEDIVKEIDEGIENEVDVDSLVNKLGDIENLNIDDVKIPKDFVQKIKEKDLSSRRFKRMKILKAAAICLIALSATTVTANAVTDGAVVDTVSEISNKVKVMINGKEIDTKNYEDKDGKINVKLKKGDSITVDQNGGSGEYSSSMTISDGNKDDEYNIDVEIGDNKIDINDSDSSSEDTVTVDSNKEDE